MLKSSATKSDNICRICRPDFTRDTEMAFKGATSRLNGLKNPGGGTPYNGLYGEAPPERGTFFRL